MTPEELVEILQTILEEQQSAFSNRRAQAEEKRKADIRLIQEQDAAFAASLQADQVRLIMHFLIYISWVPHHSYHSD